MPVPDFAEEARDHLACRAAGPQAWTSSLRGGAPPRRVRALQVGGMSRPRQNLTTWSFFDRRNVDEGRKTEKNKFTRKVTRLARLLLCVGAALVAGT